MKNSFRVTLICCLLSSQLNAETVSFVALGDFGTGDWRQHAVSEAIGKVCSEQRLCNLAVGLGDNIYDHGATSENDLNFLTRFEVPYANLDMPFYMTLGNHDITRIKNKDNLDIKRGDIQVQYHYREDRISNKWYMPARYYHVPYPEESPDTDFLSLDSSTLAGDNAYQKEYDQQEQITAHTNWLSNLMPQLKARWRIAFTHYPYLSNGRHGNAGDYDGVQGRGQLWQQLVENNLCDKVHLLLSGHDHTLQFLQANSQCGRTLFVVSGAAGKRESLVDKNRNPAYWQSENTLGFFWIQLTESDMTIEAWTLDRENQPEMAWQSKHSYFPLNDQEVLGILGSQ
ncbi:metallophosphoesterase [Parendozoicomonas sp. Alg238-R29]|uniref:metallophosphoesterase n=1 Tax=Parendozoicomonas sp. Alg238-R29 TaxID=2993446 RepID=UPI00248DAA3F|nr:metallophosphoesterase [Parendozoicomonas sp. Alg238-R29]